MMTRMFSSDRRSVGREEKSKTAMYRFGIMFVFLMSICVQKEMVDSFKGSKAASTYNFIVESPGPFPLSTEGNKESLGPTGIAKCRDVEGFYRATKASHCNEFAEGGETKEQLCDWCTFVTLNKDCEERESILSYVQYLYCNPKIWSYPILAAWLSLLMSVLSTTADTLFVPPVTQFGDFLRLSPAVAGLTLLSMANAGIDIITSMAALSVEGGVPLLIGGLAGAAAFIFTIVLACIIYYSNQYEPASKVEAHIVPAEFYRDVGSYMIMIVIQFSFVYVGSISIQMATGVVAFYSCYLFTVLSLGHLHTEKVLSVLRESEAVGDMNNDYKESLISKSGFKYRGSNFHRGTYDRGTYDEGDYYSSINVSNPSHIERPSWGSHRADRLLFLAEERDFILSNGEVGSRRSSIGSFVDIKKEHVLENINNELETLEEIPDDAYVHNVPIALADWSEATSLFSMIYFVAETPFIVLRLLTVPPPDEFWDPSRRLWAIVSFNLSGVIIMLSFCGGVESLELKADIFGQEIPVWLILVVLGGACSLTVMYTTNGDNQPKYRWIITTIGWLASLAWMNLLAAEIIGVISSFGVALHIAPSYLGVTILGVANAVGDLAADIAVTKAGRAGMAYGHLFGGPLCTDSLGIMLPLIYEIVNNQCKPLIVDINDPDFKPVKLAWSFNLCLLTLNLIAFPAFKFKPPVWYAGLLVVIYVVYLSLTMLLASGTL